jgi:SAM-dependent methyltransferase
LERGEEKFKVQNLVREARSRLHTPVPICKICDLPEYNDADWLSAASAMGLPTDGTYCTKKYWEYTQLLYGLRRLKCLQSNARALSVGCGREPHLYYLTNHIAEVVGIDLLQGDSGVPKDIIRHPEKYSPMPYQRGRLKLMRMDGRRLQFPSNSFDIVFSLSSIEHFGGHEAAAQAMREIGRVLKPGGVAAIATELIITDAKHPEFFCWSDLLEYVIRPSNLQLVEQVDVSISESLKEHFVHVSEIESPLYLLVHWGNPPNTVPFTSVMLFMTKSH